MAASRAKSGRTYHPNKSVLQAAGRKLSDLTPELGLGNTAKMATGIIGGLVDLGASLAPGGKPAGSVASRFGKGILHSFANTISTAVKPLGIPFTEFGASDVWEDAVAKWAGEEWRPADFMERARDKNIGLLPALIEDVGNVAMVAGGVGAVGKLGAVGKVANAGVLAESANLAGTSARTLTRAGKASTKVEKLGLSEAQRAAMEPQVLRRAGTLSKLETAAHPYQAAWGRGVRPLAQAAQERVLANATGVGREVRIADRGIALAQAAVARAEGGNGDLAAAQADLATAQGNRVANTNTAARATVPDGGAATAANQAQHVPPSPDATLAPGGVTRDSMNARAGVLRNDPDINPARLDEITQALDDFDGYLRADKPILAEDRLLHAEFRAGKIDDEAAGAAWDNQPVNDFIAPWNEYAKNEFTRHRSAIDDLKARRDNGDISAEDFTTERDRLQNEYDTWRGEYNTQRAEAYERAQRARYEPIVDDAPADTPVSVPGRAGQPDIEAIEPMASPAAEAAEAAYLAAIPGWSTRAVNRLPMGVVRMLGSMHAKILQHDVTRISREMSRIVESARRQTSQSPKVRIAIEKVVEPLIGKPDPRTGIGMTRETAQELVGAEIIARLDGATLLEVIAIETGSGLDPIAKLAIDETMSGGARIGKDLINDLGLEEVLVAVTDLWRVSADERVATLIGGRTGAAGLEHINSNTPTLTRKQIDLYGKAVRLLRDAERLRALIDGEIEQLNSAIVKKKVEIGVKNTMTTADMDVIAGLEEEVTALYNAQVFHGDPALKNKGFSALIEATAPSDGGGSLDTSVGELIDTTAAPVAVSVSEGTMKRVLATEWDADGGAARILDEVSENPIFRDSRVRIGVYRHKIDHAEDLSAADKAAGIKIDDVVIDIDPSITHWPTSVDASAPLQPITREQGILIGRMFNQDSIWDQSARGGAGDTVRVRGVNDDIVALSSHFTDLSSRPNSGFSKFVKGLRDVAADQRNKSVENPISDEAIDAFIDQNMVMAWGWAKSQGKSWVDADGVPTQWGLDQWFARQQAQTLKRRPGGNGDSLLQVVMDIDAADAPFVEALRESMSDFEPVTRWYNASHDGIQALANNRTFTLGDGRVIGMDELFYQIVAVTSFQASPQSNLGYASNTLMAWTKFLAEDSPALKLYLGALDRWSQLPEAERTAARLNDEIYSLHQGAKNTRLKKDPITKAVHGDKSGLSPNEGTQLRVLSLILSGHTMDKWGAETLLDVNMPFGGQRKGTAQGKIADGKVLEALEPEVRERVQGPLNDKGKSQKKFGDQIKDLTPEELKAAKDAARAAEPPYEPKSVDELLNKILADPKNADLLARARLEAEAVATTADTPGLGDLDLLTEQRVIALFYGEKGWAKIMSFWQNLADPARSRAVTLDTVMARGYNQTGWGKQRIYYEFSEKVSRVADRLGIPEHAVQAAVWVHVKKVTEQGRVAIIRGSATSAMKMTENPRFRFGSTRDPVMVMYRIRLTREAEKAAADAAEAAGSPKPTKTAPIMGKHTFDTADEIGGEVTKQKINFRLQPAGSLEPTRTGYDAYLLAADEANALLKKGDVDGAKARIEKWARKEATTRETPGRDMGQILSDPTGEVLPNHPIFEHLGTSSDEIADILEANGDEILDGLEQQINGRTAGAMRVNAEGKIVMSFFNTADASTLFHENMHALRSMLPPETIAALEEHYGLPTGGFADDLVNNPARRDAEEAFADDFGAFLVNPKRPSGNSTALDGILAEVREALNGRGQSLPEGTLNPTMQAIWDEFLDPVLPTETAASRFDSVGAARVAPEGASAERIAYLNSLEAHPGETTANALKRQHKIGTTIAKISAVEVRVAKRARRVAVLQSERAAIQKVLDSGETKSAIRASKAEIGARSAFERLAGQLENPSTRQVPGPWQPLKAAIDSLWDQAAGNDILAASLEGLPETFAQILEAAARHGFDPVHVRSFTPDQTKRLVYSTVQLGTAGRQAGREITAGTRRPRLGGVARTQSLEALIAGVVEATHEVQTNALVDFIESSIARPIVDGAVPKGWVVWDPVKTWIIRGEKDTPPGTTTILTPSPTTMIPKSVANGLHMMGKSYDHWAFRAIGKPSSWWRTFVLTLSPQWYVNNLIGNIAMASAEGVSFTDWAKAWRSYRQRGTDSKLWSRGPRQGGAFEDLPGTPGGSAHQELGKASIVPPAKGWRGARAEQRGQPLKERWELVKARLLRANEVVDEIARAAVYHRTIRTTGNPALALQRSYAALVDYGDLGPLERSLVRAVIPFYAWQKGILKTVTRIGIENPAAVAVMMQLNNLHREVLRDTYGGDLPEAYQGIVDLPLIGAINTRGFNPFQDASTLLRANGIADSANPFIEAIVRNQLNAPETLRSTDMRVNPFGSLVGETNVPQDVLSTFTSGLPQYRVARALAGRPAYPGAPVTGRSQATAGFVGIKRLSTEDIQRIIQRARESSAVARG